MFRAHLTWNTGPCAAPHVCAPHTRVHLTATGQLEQSRGEPDRRCRGVLTRLQAHRHIATATSPTTKVGCMLHAPPAPGTALYTHADIQVGLMLAACTCSAGLTDVMPLALVCPGVCSLSDALGLPDSPKTVTDYSSCQERCQFLLDDGQIPNTTIFRFNQCLYDRSAYVHFSICPQVRIQLHA